MLVTLAHSAILGFVDEDRAGFSGTRTAGAALSEAALEKYWNAGVIRKVVWLHQTMLLRKEIEAFQEQT